MNRGKKKERQEQEREYGKLTSFKLLRCYEGRDVVFFSAEINGVTIYNMRVITNRNGEDFIAFPSVKGKNGSYFNEAYFAFSPEDTAKVIKAIEEALDAQDGDQDPDALPFS